LLARGQLDCRPDEAPAVSDAVGDAMAVLGIYCEEEIVIDDDEFWLWPENEDAFLLWLSIQTQWVMGAAGPAGLNYSGVEACMRMQGVGKKQQRQLFESIWTMECAALEEWASQR